MSRDRDPEAVLIREFVSADREATVRLLASVFGYDQPHNHPGMSVDRKVEHGDELFLVACIDDQVVGTVMGGYDGHRGWLYSLAVDPDWQRLGIATRLVRAIEDRLQRRGCPKINLQVISENRDVVAFYESLGYNVQDRISLGKPLIRE